MGVKPLKNFGLLKGNENPNSPDAESRHFSGLFLNVGVKPPQGESLPQWKEAAMRDRKKQRELRKTGIRKEEKLDLYDYCGIKDPTPYLAVKNMIRRGEAAARAGPQWGA